MAECSYLGPLVFWSLVVVGFLWWSVVARRRRPADAVLAFEQFEVDHHARIVSLRKGRFFECVGDPKAMTYRVVIRYDSGRKREALLFYGRYGLRVVWIDSPDPEGF